MTRPAACWLRWDWRRVFGDGWGWVLTEVFGNFANRTSGHDGPDVQEVSGTGAAEAVKALVRIYREGRAGISMLWQQAARDAQVPLPLQFKAKAARYGFYVVGSFDLFYGIVAV